MKPGASTVPGVLAERAREDGDVRAIVTPDGAVTYRELDDASREVAARLAAGGVGKGDRIALLAPNGIEWAALAYGVMRTGAVLVPLSTLLRRPELEAHLATAEVSHVVAVRELRGRRYLDELERGRQVWTVDDLPEPGPPAAEEADPDDDLVVLFTSGSTGTPKGTIHTHAGALRATAASLEARGVRTGERLYLPMPFFWTGGFGQGLLSALLAGATLLTEAEPEPSRTLRFLERERVTLFRGWPDQAARLAAHPAFAGADLSSLGDASLGAVLPPERRPAPGARPNLFGMTETFGPWCGDRLDVDLPPE
jgi:acyl-CoA synthetase (AMP-forming)/AMP-acid ligase II